MTLKIDEMRKLSEHMDDGDIPYRNWKFEAITFVPEAIAEIERLHGLLERARVILAGEHSNEWQIELEQLLKDIEAKEWR